MNRIWNRKFLLAFACLLTLEVSKAFCQAGAAVAYTPPPPPAPPDPAALLFRLVALTAALVALCIIVMWSSRRLNKSVVGDEKASPRLKLEGSLVIGRRCALHLLKADGQDIAVTTDGGGLRSIVVLSEPFDKTLAEVATAP